MSATSNSASSTGDARLALLRKIWRQLHRSLQALQTSQSVPAVQEARAQARSLRVLLGALRSELNPHSCAQLRFELKSIDRELRASRLADAQLRILRELSPQPRLVNTGDILNVIALLERRAGAARGALVHALRERRWHDRQARIAAHLADPELMLCAARSAELEYRGALAQGLRGAMRVLNRRRVDRIEMKKERGAVRTARYLCEQLQQSVQPNLESAAKHLAAAHDLLEEIRDLQSLSKNLRAAPLPTALYNKLRRQLRKRRDGLVEQYVESRLKLRLRLQKACAKVAVDGSLFG